MIAKQKLMDLNFCYKRVKLKVGIRSNRCCKFMKIKKGNYKAN